ncbi:MAG: M20/M25/M40 family metallo-hydrolase [Hydrotalea flava]|nr:M20/M25/M40 family metallo-hydrolase [Hydrotalea flava]NIM37617.1 M20/M25/M40 family metallo-hydrolase [Hydrotalea flava]NIN02777.1 M20/M25/M40 family metallo-hydrolase [Hydrotalea flava]NIN14462.1 M20/M25/M40 family metallo-hydrolase [Hydrotalea flava]NIO93543.1 M20/M25/M40 family metallo-hydrolase [Hydrotalea flava]
MMKKLLLVIWMVPSMAFAQQPSDSLLIKQISDDVLINGKAYDLLRQLTKQIGGRLAGSPQFMKAVLWGQQAMKEMGADTVYIQQCMVPHWVRGGKDVATVVQIGSRKVKKSLSVTALGNSLGAKPGGITAPVLAVHDFAELEARKAEAKGKIVFFNYPFNPTYIIPGRAYGESGVYRRNGASIAAKYGAIGIIIRSLSGSTDNNAHTGVMAYNDSLPKIPAAALGLQDADSLFAWCQRMPVQLHLETHGHFLPDTIGYNVVGVLNGTEQIQQYITVGGHLDSWDEGEGAHDNGAGVVQTIEISRAFKAVGYRPKHSIHLVLFANEENGLRGGNEYARVAAMQTDQPIFALESDEGGFTPRGFGCSTSPEKLAMIRSWIPLLQPYGTDVIAAGGGGADIGPLARHFKIPACGLMPDNQRYFDIHHTKADVFEAVNKRELLLGAINMAGLVYLVDKYF